MGNTLNLTGKKRGLDRLAEELVEVRQLFVSFNDQVQVTRESERERMSWAL